MEPHDTMKKECEDLDGPGSRTCTRAQKAVFMRFFHLVSEEDQKDGEKLAAAIAQAPYDLRKRAFAAMTRLLEQEWPD